MDGPDVHISAVRIPLNTELALVASQDFYAIHKLLCSAFPSGAARQARILFRFDIENDAGWLCVQTLTPPDWSRLAERTGLQIAGPIPLQIPEAARLRFRLLARPTYRIGRQGDPERGRRAALEAEQDQLDWLRRKAAAGGFEVLACSLTDRIWFDTRSNPQLENGAPRPLHATQFDGILAVTDRGRLRTAIRNGIGPQKAFGFGLLSVARI